jgi:hypothetical protein
MTLSPFRLLKQPPIGAVLPDSFLNSCRMTRALAERGDPWREVQEQ